MGGSVVGVGGRVVYGLTHAEVLDERLNGGLTCINRPTTLFDQGRGTRHCWSSRNVPNTRECPRCTPVIRTPLLGRTQTAPGKRSCLVSRLADYDQSRQTDDRSASARIRDAHYL